MRQVYLVPSTITAFGLACGLFIIFKAETGPGGYEMLHTSALILILAAVADLLDGAVARIIHAESEFGTIFDSMADAISFGVVPSVLLIRSLSLEQGTPLALFTTACAMIFSVCGVLRLVRFSIKAKQVKGDTEASSMHNKNFTGLPITAAAPAAVSALLFLHSPEMQAWFPLSDSARGWILSGLMLLLGYLMVSHWKFMSLKRLRIRVPSFPLLILTVVAAVSLLYGLLHHFPIAFAAVSWSYVILGCALTFIRLIAGRKSKTLEDFEPEADELE